MNRDIIEWYFHTMLGKSISRSHNLVGFLRDGDNIIFKYVIKHKSGDEFLTKNSSYTVSKDFILEKWRESQIEKIITQK